LRVDRFDANQSVLTDPFSLQETRKAREFNFSGNNARPENIGDDYVVYVKDKKNTSLNDVNNIAGYRNGNRWYNASGQEVADPNVIAQANSEGRATPALLDPNNTDPFSAAAFRDYKPQVNLMPRIAFQFPISDVAQFFAHYDVLTQRPTERNRLDPLDYFFLANSIGNIVNNPDLKPQRTIDYEVGFKQALNQSSALTISAFYREMRNLIQVIPVNFAWPVTYTTMGNIDFGTVKGLSLAYDLRRTGNVRLTANYTLQFADGTGSSSTGAFNLLQSGQPNLRTTIPLSFDTRHQIQTTFDYRYGEGKYYNGPRIKGKNILQNTGLNLVMIANSGTPYSASSVFTQDGSFGNAGRPQLKGSLNGSRLPFQFRLNARLDRSFTLKYGKKKEGDERKTADLQVYVLVQNLLNNLNIVNVYRATGNPNDDGYLTALTSLQNIQQQLDPVSFAQLYAAKINNPDNYARPRVIRIGAILNF
jgi:outer membrane receptor protein involved in Fe transport